MKYLPALLSLFFILPMEGYSQTVRISGYVIDAKDKKPIPFASATLWQDAKIPINGGSTDHEGKFIFNADSLSHKTDSFIKVECLGYRPVIINNLYPNGNNLYLGVLRLEEDVKQLEAVIVSYSPPPFTYKLDRKSINAGSFPNANLAIDLLENIPSVRVDNEGRLTYRGEGTFLIYINGVQVANGEERLKQLPASQVETLDIITNPSASYSADGDAGIIQITLKKNRLEGYNIYSGVSANTRGSIGLAFSVDKKYKSNGWYINGKVGETVWEKYASAGRQIITSADEGKSIVTYDQDYRNKEFSTYLEGGFNLDLTKNDYLDISFSINPSYTQKRNRGLGRFTEEEYLNNAPISNSAYDSDSRIYYDYQYYGTTLSYYHAFNPKKTHKLSLDLQYSGYLDELKEKRIDTRDYATRTERIGYQAYEKNRNRLLAKLNYQVPFNDRFSAAGGFEYTYDCIPETGSVNGTFDAAGTITPFADEPENQKVYFKQAVYSGFLNARYEADKVSVMLGARIESTARELNYSYTDKGVVRENPTEKSFTNFFPYFHLTCSPGENNQFSLSFSQRIRRPDYWSLIPFTQYMTQYSYYKGNADITPAKTYIAEVGYLRKFNRNFISGELFFRQTGNHFANYSTPVSETMLLVQPQNIGRSTLAGLELMVGWDIFDCWNLNASASVYMSWLNYEFGGVRTASDRVKSDFRLNNTFKLPAKFSVKLDMYYYSAVQGIQTEQQGYFVSNISVDKRFANDRWRVGISWYDLFFSNDYKTTTKGIDLYKWDHYREKPNVSFRIWYYFNNQN